MSKRRKALSFVSELGLWGLANLLCTAIVSGTIYGVGHELLGWGKIKFTTILVLGLVLTATWGSWATLVWTRNRGLRAVQQAATMIPGLLTMVGGGALLYVGFVAWYVGAFYLLIGLGMSAASVTLAGGFMTQNNEPNKLQYLLGVALFPLMSTMLAGLVTFALMTFLPTPLSVKFKDFFTLGTLMTFVMGSTLISTVIPALCSRACQELSVAWSIKTKNR